MLILRASPPSFILSTQNGKVLKKLCRQMGRYFMIEGK